MSNEMYFSLSDIYPNMKTITEDTGTKANPDYQDQEVLNENSVAEKTDRVNASRKKVFLTLILIVSLVWLFGKK